MGIPGGSEVKNPLSNGEDFLLREPLGQRPWLATVWRVPELYRTDPCTQTHIQPL